MLSLNGRKCYFLSAWWTISATVGYFPPHGTERNVHAMRFVVRLKISDGKACICY